MPRDTNKKRRKSRLQTYKFGAGGRGGGSIKFRQFASSQRAFTFILLDLARISYTMPVLVIPPPSTPSLGFRMSQLLPLAYFVATVIFVLGCYFTQCALCIREVCFQPSGNPRR
ncbi:hypothetical protein B0H10DRAFT_1012340 [Mycena sp. CBHHK59/15]|nr:hypothetical protein B0H10DRAFT_1012340 [Mycena sp. CBHHK59/15]